MIITKASINDIDPILEVLAEQRLHLKNMGIPQWQGDYPAYIDFKEDVDGDRLYVIKENDEVAGFFALVYPDHNYDYVENGAWSLNTPYIAVHRMGVANKYKKSGFASKAFDYVKGMYDHVRVDTHEVNEAMNNCLKKNGFKYVGVVYMEDKTPRNAYEWYK